MNPKTVSGDQYISGSVTIGENLVVEQTTSTNILNANIANIGTENIANFTATSATIQTENVVNSTVTNSFTTNASIATEAVTTSNIVSANIQSATITAEVVTNSAITNAGITNLSIGAPSFIFNSLPFYYGSGPWTPILTYVTSDSDGGLKDFITLDGATSVSQNGWYDIIGSEITCYYDVQYLGGTQSPGTNGCLFPAIRNFPYQFKQLGGNNFTVSQTTEISEWPNGLAGAVPSPLATPTYPSPFIATLFTQGTVNELYQQIFPAPVLVGVHTYDGYTMPFYTNCNFYVPVVAIPPYACISTTNGLVDNFNMSYGNLPVRFQGSITYNIQ